jgi:hypothetical protein
MSVSIVATENGRTITAPDSPTLARWAYETHCETCATCRRGETWCNHGRALLAATAPTNDLPGFPAI